MSQFQTDRFRHVTVALNTPFHEDGSLNLEAAAQLTRYFINKGIRQLYVCGSTGEGFLLNDEERMALAEAVCAEAKDEMNIIVHVGTASTRHACQLAAHAEKVGAAAISAVPCVYYRLGDESVYQHWTAITEAANLPFFIYNIPQLTGFNLSVDLLKRMLSNPRIAGVKCSSDPVLDILRYKEAGGSDFIVFNGPDEQYLGGRMMGADAGIGGTYGAMPELYLKLEALIRRGDAYDKAYQLQVRITDLIMRLLSFGSLYGAVKALLYLNGVDCGKPRLPFLPVEPTDERLVALHRDINACIAEVSAW